MTHPKHPPRPRDTRSLLGSLAVAVVMLAVLLMATSCAPIPRAIIPPASEIAKLDVAPLAAAGKVTREAVREVAKAGENTRETAVHLRASIDRAEKIAEAHEELREAFREIQTFAKRLSADLILAEEKERIALATIDSLEDEIAALKANAQSQATQIRHAKTNETTLREQVVALAGSDAKRIIAENKLQFWRWRFAPISIGLIVIMVAFLILKPRFL